MQRDSFVFYKSFREATKKLSKSTRTEIYDALFDYALEGIEPEYLRPVADSIFLLIKPQIDANYRKYRNRIGKIKNKTGTKEEQNENKVSTNENENVNENVNVNNLKEKNTEKENDEIIIQFENEVWTKYPFVSNKKQSLQKWKNKTKIERLKFLEIYNDFLDYCKLATWYSKDLQFLLSGNNWDVDWKTKTEQEKAKHNARGQPPIYAGYQTPLLSSSERASANFRENFAQEYKKQDLDIEQIERQLNG